MATAPVPASKSGGILTAATKNVPTAPTKVSQAIIDEFRKGGMGAAIKKYNSGQGSAEFNEAVKRYYPGAYRANSSPTSPKPVNNAIIPEKPTTAAGTTSTNKSPNATPTAKPDYTYNPNPNTNIPNSSHDLSKVKAANAPAKKTNQSLGSSKNAGQFISRLGRNVKNDFAASLNILGGGDSKGKRPSHAPAAQRKLSGYQSGNKQAI